MKIGQKLIMNLTECVYKVTVPTNLEKVVFLFPFFLPISLSDPDLANESAFIVFVILNLEI